MKECWNSMYTFNEKASYQIIAVKEFLSNDNNYHLIVVTDTNPMHHDFNLKQISGQEFDNSRVHFINSFDPLVKGKSKFDRAISGIVKLQLKKILPERQNISITSCHSSIDAHQLLRQLQPQEEFRGKHTANVRFGGSAVNVRTTGKTNIADAFAQALANRTPARANR